MKFLRSSPEVIVVVLFTGLVATAASTDKCLRGDGRACLALAHAEKDPSLLEQYLQRACDAGQADGCHELGLRVTNLRADEAQAVHGAQLFQTACDLGRLASCGSFAEMLLFGGGVAVNPELARVMAARAQAALEAGCKKGLGLDCDTRAFMSFTGLIGKPNDAEKYWALALPLLEKGCAKGDGAQCRVAGILLQHYVAKTDTSRASALTRRGCELGNSWACDTVAWGFEGGVGFPVDATQAAHFAEQACNLGNQSGCRLAAQQYQDGSGVPKDESRAAALYKQVDTALERRCEWLDGASCWLLRDVRNKHHTVTMSDEQRRALDEKTKATLRTQCPVLGGWFCQMLAWENWSSLQAWSALEKRACDDGIWWSCRDLAAAYRSGERVAASEGRAHWYDDRACALGHFKSCENAKASTVAASAPPRSSSQTCFAGQYPDADGVGQCCWPGQGYTSKAARCVGAPQCPSGLVVVGESCQCAGGQIIDASTQGHCCWEGQRWSASANACEGVATKCPATHFAAEGTCRQLPSCADGLEATQATGGTCCWPGQSFSNGKCAGRPTRCRAGWVASQNDCVPGIAEVWPYLSAAVSRAVSVEVPVYSEFNSGNVRLGGWAYYTGDSHLEGGPGCTVTLVENRQHLTPDEQEAITPSESRATFNLAKVNHVLVTVKSRGAAAGGSWTTRFIDGRSSDESFTVFFSLGEGEVRRRYVSTAWVYDEASERNVQKPETTDSVEGAVLFETSFRGAAIEAARAFIAAGRACGGDTFAADFDTEGKVPLTTPYDLGAEQRDADIRVRLQQQAWSQGRAELRRAQAAARASSAAAMNSILSAFSQSASQISAWNQNLSRATHGLAVVPAQPTFAPSQAMPPQQPMLQQPTTNPLSTGMQQTAPPTTAAVGAGFQILPTGCQACKSDCDSSFKRCEQDHVQTACYENAACVCRCMKNLGGCGTSMQVLDQCIENHITQTTTLAKGTGTTIDPSAPKSCEGVSYPKPPPTGDSCKNCSEYWNWKHAQCLADAAHAVQTPANFCKEQASPGAQQRCNDMYMTTSTQCCAGQHGAGVAR